MGARTELAGEGLSQPHASHSSVRKACNARSLSARTEHRKQTKGDYSKKVVGSIAVCACTSPTSSYRDTRALRIEKERAHRRSRATNSAVARGSRRAKRKKRPQEKPRSLILLPYAPSPFSPMPLLLSLLCPLLCRLLCPVSYVLSYGPRRAAAPFDRRCFPVLFPVSSLLLSLPPPDPVGRNPRGSHRSVGRAMAHTLVLAAALCDRRKALKNAAARDHFRERTPKRVLERFFQTARSLPWPRGRRRVVRMRLRGLGRGRRRRASSVGRTRCVGARATREGGAGEGEEQNEPSGGANGRDLRGVGVRADGAADAARSAWLQHGQRGALLRAELGHEGTGRCGSATSVCSVR